MPISNPFVLLDDSVDDTKLGDRAPQFYRRQGSDANDWMAGVWASLATQTPGAVRTQGGVIEATIADGQNYVTYNTSFPTAFSNNPLIYTALHDPQTRVQLSVYAESITSTGVGFTVCRTGTSGSFTVDIVWLAIGPE